MKVLHVVPEINEANGVYQVARMLARESGDEVVALADVTSDNIVGYSEVWVHGMWLPREWCACWKVLRNVRMCECSNVRPKLVRMTHGSLSPIYLERQGKWKKRLVGPIERWLLRRSDRIVATCEAEKAWISAYVGKGCPEIFVEDLKRFFDFKEQGEGRKEKDDGLHLLYLGRRHPLKGVEFLERAVKEIEQSNNPNNRTIDFRIVSNHFGEELERDWEWCDVLVLPTLSENFGLVVAEALERGKRVITTDGAPAWGEGGLFDCSDCSDCSIGCGGRLIYLKGYREGTDEERVDLLKRAIERFMV